MPASANARRIALVLGGGAARGLAHIGALEVLEREGIIPEFVAGSSMGGLIGALHAAGLGASEIAALASRFRFPSWFVPGGLLEWGRIFPSAEPALSGLTFERLRRRLALVAVDIEAGQQVVLCSGDVLAAVKATCAVPAVLVPVQIGGRWLVDGGLVNVLPVDVAHMFEPEIVLAVKVGAQRARTMPQLRRAPGTILEWIARFAPNPLSARFCFDLLVRAAEIALDRQNTLLAAMAHPELLVEVDVGTIALRDFHRLDEAMEAGRRAMEAALPALRCLVAAAPARVAENSGSESPSIDPVCQMVVSPGRARATFEHLGRTYYFCSTNCRDGFVRDPERYACTR